MLEACAPTKPNWINPRDCRHGPLKPDFLSSTPVPNGSAMTSDANHAGPIKPSRAAVMELDSAEKNLFSPLPIRDLLIPNRIVISPMCQYSAVEGEANDWHFAHLAKFALGGAGTVIVEATAVERDGRISPGDL